LQQENEELKESLKEHQSVLEFIMTKYREQMIKLVELKREQEICENFYKAALDKVKTRTKPNPFSSIGL
jgi:hypothetical protein